MMSGALLVVGLFFLLLGAGWKARSAAALLLGLVIPPALWFTALERAPLAGLRPLDLFLRYLTMLIFIASGLSRVGHNQS
jgi:hypothetical protein